MKPAVVGTRKGARYAGPRAAAAPPHDPVNSPAHYTEGGIECIDYLRAKLSVEEYMGFLRGNAIKYLTRMNDKGQPIEDVEKAIWYLRRLLSLLTQEVVSDE